MARGMLYEPDISRISLELGYEIDFWTRRLGFSERDLRHAVGAVGHDPEAVERFLRQRW
jgi:hypothetical protein